MSPPGAEHHQQFAEMVGWKEQIIKTQINTLPFGSTCVENVMKLHWNYSSFSVEITLEKLVQDILHNYCVKLNLHAHLETLQLYSAFQMRASSALQISEPLSQ